MNDQFNILFVNAHTKGRRRYNNMYFIPDERLLICNFIICVHFSIERFRWKAVAGQLFCNFSRALGSGNINDFLRASFTFTALDPLFYDTETTQLFSDSNGSLSFTYRGSAPALPIIDLNVIGAESEKVILSINDDVDIIYQPVFDIQATDIVYDFENYNFSPVGVVSFSTDYRKIMIPVGPVNIKTDTHCSYSLKFKNRYFGV